MVIGILSDTHDRPSATAAGLAALREAGATLFIHCGDIGGEEILELLADNHPAVCVWGNTDVDRVELSRYAAKLGIDCRGEFADLEFDGKKIAVTHGDDVRLMQRATGGQQYDYLLHGHTHVARDWRLGRLRIINPGALYRAAKKTVAILDTRTDAVKYLTVEVG
jgi:putative phosphoesterase